MGLKDRLIHGWNAFKGEEKYDPLFYQNLGLSNGLPPDKPQLRIRSERTIIASIYNRLALDVADITLQHVRTDENGHFVEVIKSDLNECLTVSANIDQTARQFIQDVCLSLFDEGVIAIVPVDTTLDPTLTSGFDIQSLRVGQIVDWYPRHVRLRVYNDQNGRKDEIVMPKERVAIVENPFYAVMNERGSILQRLVRKLQILDAIDEQSGSGKLDMVIQLPYVLNSDLRKKQAEERRKSIEMQLSGSKYGIAYVDATEHITQLNRSLENNLMKQIEYLTSTLYGQLGLDESIMNGTAGPDVMNNYYHRTTEAFVAAIVNSMNRTFLSKTARSQGQRIMYFRDPFKLFPIDLLAEIADKMTRNEIMSSNEFRAIIGYRPSDDPRADELRNKNLNAEDNQLPSKEPNQRIRGSYERKEQ